MGGHPWFYVVPYEPDLMRCLEKLRDREFNAGRYNPSEPFPAFPVDFRHVPGCKHASMEAAREDADADGTRSILDMIRISPKADYGVVTPLGEDELMDLYGTNKPTLADIEANEEVFEGIERGHGICIVAYDGDKPSHIYFYGYSYD